HARQKDARFVWGSLPTPKEGGPDEAQAANTARLADPVRLVDAQRHARLAGLARLERNEGETLAVMGPSGCGKSTLLHLLGGPERPSAGEVWLDGRRIQQLSEKALARLRRNTIGLSSGPSTCWTSSRPQRTSSCLRLLAGSSPRVARRRAAELPEQVGL